MNALEEEYTYIFCQTGGAVENRAGAVFLILLQFIVDLECTTNTQRCSAMTVKAAHSLKTTST